MNARNPSAKTSAARENRAESMRYSNNSIKVGNITNASGVAIGAGAQASVIQVRTGTSDEVVMAFAALRQKVNALPGGPDQVVAKSAIDVLEAEAAKGDRANESNVSRWLSLLADAAPDIWEVAVDTFLNPIKGLGTAFKKIAERAKAEKNGRRDYG